MAVTRLKDFSYFMLGCEAICLYSGDSHVHSVNPEAETREYTEALTYIEAVLSGLAERTVGDYIPELLKLEPYTDLSPEEPVLALVYCGLDDSAELVLAKAGLAPHEVWLVNHVFNLFFSGELRERFTMTVPRKMLRRKNKGGH